jgi:hypothetical protein
MLRLLHGLNRALVVCAVLLLAGTLCFAQESRGSITGKVLDPTGAVVPGAKVTVTDVGTNVSNTVTANSTGYWEVNFLTPGEYTVTAEAAGFTTLKRSGITLDTGVRLALDLKLAIGESSVSVTVNADAPLLNSTTAATGRVLNTQDMADLPFGQMNPMVLQAMAAGMIFTGSLQPDNNRALDHASTANYASGGLGTGLNEFLLDGNPTTGTNGGRSGYVALSDAVDEVRVATSPFDASMGHAIGSFISLTTKSGSNEVHGAGAWQMQQFRWNATPEFTRATWLAGGQVGPEQASGKVSTPGFTFGGPVYIPHVYNGKNRFFFFVSYYHMTSLAPPTSTPNYTVPTPAEKNGDFSALLTVPTNASTYIVYDPRSAATGTGSEAGHVVRTPFPNNVLPASLLTNPMRAFWDQIYPLPNNPPTMGPDGTNNFYDGSQGNNDWFPDFLNRYDYVITDRQRLNGKWYFNHRFSDQYDWAHSTPLKGVMSNGLFRPTRGGSLDYVYAMGANNVLDLTFSITQYCEGDKKPIDYKYTAVSAGLPSYIDQKAQTTDQDVMPWVNIAGMADAASTSFVGAPGLNQRGTTEQLAPKMTTIKGNNTFKYGVEIRRYQYSSVGAALTTGAGTGYYQFSNNYDKYSDNVSSSATTTTGLGYAAYLMGLPNSITLDTNDSGFWTTPYQAAYLQDDFRVTSKLRLGFGLRFEHEGGITERFNRGIEGQYDFNFSPPYASAVSSAYSTLLTSAANAGNAAVMALATGVPANEFNLNGGVSYIGQQFNNFTQGTKRFLPNVSLVYQVTPKTVIRIGTGWFSDTYNAMTTRPAQNGYNQTTSTTITTDNGLTYCCGANNGTQPAAGLTGTSILSNPFPVLASGSRWVLPFGNTLGENILDGQGFTQTPRNYSPTWEQRYSFAVQRQIFSNDMVEASYNGGYASLPMTRNMSYLPAQYWNFADARSSTTDTNMTATVANPFLSAVSSIQASNPTLANYLSTVGMFTSTTLQVQQLLRAYPNAGFGLSEADYWRSKDVDNEVRVVYHRRAWKGLQSDVQYAHMWGRQQYLENQFDPAPEWQLNSNIRPNRFVWSTVFQLPFGKGRTWLTHGPLNPIVGGWTLSWTYTYQSGALISWGNLFYYGTVDQVVSALNESQTHSQYLKWWYSLNAVWQGTTAPPAGFVGFEGRSSAQPNTYNARIWPQYVNSLRNDPIRDWDARILRNFRIWERLSLEVAVDLLNVTNHTQFGGPNTTVTSTTFGQLTSQANSGRIIQGNVHIRF